MEFHRTLFALTRRVYVTPILIGISAVVFVLMIISGVSLTQPTSESLLKWGANFGPKTIGGEWWRLLTCTFVHIGIMHILFNMLVLASAGPLIERMLGNLGYLLTYIVAGLTGSLVSLLWNPMVVSAGASGAVFGIYGALLAIVAGRETFIPPAQLLRLRNSGIGFLIINILFSLMVPNVDLAGHVGGLVGGFLCGLVLRQPFTTEARARRPVRNTLVAMFGIVLVVGGVVGVQYFRAGVPEVITEIERFGVVERKVSGKINDADAKFQRKELSNLAFADLIEHDVLPELQTSFDRLQGVRKIPSSFEQHVADILNYIRLRQGALELFAQGLREGDSRKIQESTLKNQRADDAARKLTEKNGK